MDYWDRATPVTLPRDQPIAQPEGDLGCANLALFGSLDDRGLVDINEPFERLLTQGMVQGITYRNATTGKYIAPADVADPENPRDPNTGTSLRCCSRRCRSRSTTALTLRR